MKQNNQPPKVILNLLIMLATLGALCLPTQVATAQSVNDGFNPNSGSQINTMVLQPDGKILIGGYFSNIGGQTRQKVARLHPDGSLDDSFIPNIDSIVNTIALQSDNKIIIGGSFQNVGGASQARLARLHANGSRDTAFTPVVNGIVHSLLIQPDGKILVGGAFTEVNGQSRTAMARLNTDGSLDSAFNPAITGQNYARIMAIAMQLDGKILIGGGFTQVGGQNRNMIARLNADGSLDTDFDPGSGGNNEVMTLAVQPDGHILVGGAFTQMADQARPRLARLASDGSLDTTFLASPNSNVQTLALQPDGLILVGGSFTQISNVTRNRLGRLHPDGSLDTSFDPNASNHVYTLLVQPDAKILLGGSFIQIAGITRNRIARLYPDGSLDATISIGTDLNVFTSAVQPDGKILVGGDFTTFGGQPRQRIARLHPDGSLDSSFTPAVNDGSVVTIVVQMDGKILIGGSFTQVQGQSRNHIARLNANGSLDMGFNPDPNGAVRTLALQEDGRILLGGNFTQVGGISHTYIARLAINGERDTTFTPIVNGNVWYISVQTDGKILLGGEFTSVNLEQRNHIARLNANATLDGGFNPGSGANARVSTIAIQADGKILIGGIFSQVNGVNRLNLARLNTNGSLDSAFNPAPNLFVNALVVQTDGKILVGGGFSQIGTTDRFRLARLLPNGNLDSAFTTQVDPSTGGNVVALAVQPDGKILVGGNFINIGGYNRDRFARLSTTDASFETLDANRHAFRITWMRSGAGPELTRVSFFISTDGVNFTSLGAGTRISGGWQSTLVEIPDGSNLIVRARGFYSGANSGSIVETERRLFFGPAVFGKTHPEQNQVNVSVTPTLAWGASTDALFYAYCVGTSIDDCDVVEWTDNGTDRTATLTTALTPFTDYFWHVFAFNSQGTTFANTGDWWKFTTGPNPPGAFSKSAPSNAATDISRPPTLSWGGSTDADSYEYCLGSISGSCNVQDWTSTGSNQSATPTGLNSNTTYYWQVRAHNVSGVTPANNGAWWSFTTALAPPSPFNKNTPSNEAIVSPHALRLDWHGVGNADSYEYCLGTAIHNCDITDWTSTGTNNWVLIDLEPYTTHFWQVRAINADGTTYANAGTWWSFTTMGVPPGAFSKTAPADGATGISLSPTLSWGTSTGAVRYEYCLGTDPEDPGCNLIDWTSAGLSQSVTVFNLTPNHTYGWAVRAVNAEESVTNANDGSWWSFTTGATESDQQKIYLPLVLR